MDFPRRLCIGLVTGVSTIVLGLGAMVGLTASGAALAASPIVDVDASIEYDDNLSRAEAGKDIQQDVIVTVGTAATKQVPIGERSGLVLRGHVGAQGFADFEKLNNVSMDGFVDYRIKPGSGYADPWYSLGSGLSFRQHRGSKIRDAVEMRVRAAIGQRFNEAWAIKGGYLFDARRAFDGEAFDNRGHRLFADLRYALSTRTATYATYSVRRGEVVSVARPNPKVSSAAAEVIEPDDAFGLGCGPAAAGPLGTCAYRLDATVHRAEIGIDYALGRTTSFDVHARYFETRGDGGNHYDGLLVGSSLLVRFK